MLILREGSSGRDRRDHDVMVRLGETRSLGKSTAFAILRIVLGSVVIRQRHRAASENEQWDKNRCLWESNNMRELVAAS